MTLIHDTIYTSLVDNFRFRHFLHGKVYFILLAFDFPDLSKATFTDHIMKNEIVFGYDWGHFYAGFLTVAIWRRFINWIHVILVFHENGIFFGSLLLLLFAANGSLFVWAVTERLVDSEQRPLLALIRGFDVKVLRFK